MRAIRTAAVAVALFAMLSTGALSADSDKASVKVVYKDGKTIQLKALRVGIEEEGLFGTSFKQVRTLPVKTEDMHLEVPISNLAKIEFVEVSEDGTSISLMLTDLDGETLACTLDSEEKVIWKAVHPFADSEAVLDPAELKEIDLTPES